MASRKFSKMYMLEVKANNTQEARIEYLINTLVAVVLRVFPTAKVKLDIMDKEE